MINAERISIYIDRKSFNKSYSSFGYDLKDGLIPMHVWKHFNENVLGIYNELFKEKESRNLNNEHAHMLHRGTWLFVSERTDFLAKSTIKEMELVKEKSFLDFMSEVDSLYGFIVKYTTRTKSFNDEQSIKGVDVNIVCHMMHNAFKDHYDVAILVTDNEEFVPVVELVQDEFGKQVVHMGFLADRLRGVCFGHIPLEKGEYDEWLLDT